MSLWASIYPSRVGVPFTLLLFSPANALGHLRPGVPRGIMPLGGGAGGRSPRRSPGVPPAFPRRSPGVPPAFPRRSPGVPPAFPRRSPGVPPAFPRRSPGVPPAFPRRSPGVPPAFLRRYSGFSARSMSSWASARYASVPAQRGSYRWMGRPWLGASLRRTLRGTMVENTRSRKCFLTSSTT